MRICSCCAALSVATSLLLLGSVNAAFSQQPNTVSEREIGPELRRIQEPFSALSGIHERNDGSVVVLDPRENRLHLIDAHGRSRLIGRQGGGPGEFMMALSVIGLSGDTTLVADAGKRVFHVVGPDGSMRSTIPWPENSGLGLANVRGVDTRGRMYFIADAWSVARRGDDTYSIRDDSVPLLRWDRAANRIDSLARLRVTSPDDQQDRRVAIRSGAVPFAGRDDASVALDGRVAIVRARPFAVDIVASDGRLHRGATLPFTPIKVSEEDKQAVRRSRAGSRFLSTGTSGGQPDLTSDPFWDEFKPPFPFGRGVRTAPDGITWVERSRVANDSVPRYHLYAKDGNWTGTVRLRPRSRVVGFGGGGIWVVQEDADGLLWLTQHRAPQ